MITRMSFLLATTFAALGLFLPWSTAQAQHTIWIAANRATKLSPLTVTGSEVSLCEDGAIGDFLVPIVTANQE